MSYFALIVLLSVFLNHSTKTQRHSGSTSVCPALPEWSWFSSTWSAI